MPKEDVSPQQQHMQWTEYVHTEIKDQAKPNIKGNKYMTFLDEETLANRTENVYNNKEKKKHGKVSGYDRLFHITYDYENKLHRDDRASRLGLDVATEEKNKPITTLSSSVYFSCY